MKFKQISFVFVVCIGLSDPFVASSQAVSGVPGYVTIPVATFNKDGSVFFGTSFLPQNHLSYTHYRYDALAAYASITFLSFVEVDLRITRQLNLPSGSTHVVDRVPTIRFRILKEKKWVPAVALGFHDVITSIDNGEARHFGASYLVTTKNFHPEKLHLLIGVTGGWGANSFIWKNNELLGFFGGFSLAADYLPWLELLCDYNGATTNAGLRFTCFKHLFLTAATMNFDSFTGTVSYRFNLIR